MKQIRRHLTYANVMSSLAVFMMLGGATAVAATKIGANEIKANSIKTGKIVKEAVTAGKIKNAAVTEGKIADGAVTTNKLADNAVTTPKIANDAVVTNKIAADAVTGAKVNEATLGEVPNAANAQTLGGKSLNSVIMWAFINSNGTVARSSGGITSEQLGTGAYKVTFPQAVNTCAYNTTNAAADNVVPAVAETAVALASGGTNAVRVATGNSAGTAINDQFMLQVTC